jgi:chromosome segregation ATPase
LQKRLESALSESAAKDATIEQLNRRVAELDYQIKELSQEKQTLADALKTSSEALVVGEKSSAALGGELDRLQLERDDATAQLLEVMKGKERLKEECIALQVGGRPG